MPLRVHPKTCFSCYRAPPADDGVRELNKAKVVLSVDFVSNLQSAKEIMPAVGAFHDPATSLEARIVLSFLFFLSARLDVCYVPATMRRTAQLRIIVALVATKMLAWFLLGRWPGDNHRVQRRGEPLHVVPIGARERGRQRNAVGVGEIVSLGAQFAAICRVFSGLVAPFTGAETVAESSDW